MSRKISKFKMPTKSDLKSRTSTISNAFTIAITPYITPSQEEIDKLLQELEVEEGQCVYCLRKANATDHFRPLVKDGMPNGYISDINNLVPCCSECNSSKGKKDWDEWYTSPKNIDRLLSFGLSLEQIEQRKLVLERFAKRTEQARIDYASLVGEDAWNEFNYRRQELNKRLKTEQEFCDKLRKLIEQNMKK